ncbi:MAG TPA: NEL-type E3 ubiquitin ligase domain-containing protein, partial [Pseudomonas sp.]|nr:NEL-type E3 ubiquitin ligase domain-containing protein [Pseudomonas sp.]
MKIDGQLYEQVQEDGRWRIAHPQNAQAYRPRLQDNGEGAWYATHENPLQWDDRQLLRRLGPVSDGLEDEDLDAALQSSGTSDDAVRRAQFEGQRPPAPLADMLERLRCTRQVDEIIERVREGKSLATYKNFALPSVTELEGWPANHVIKVYTGTESWGEHVRYGATDLAHPVDIEINRGELENGELSSRIVQQLDEKALSELLPGSTIASDRIRALNDKLALHLEANRESMFDRLYARHDTALTRQSEVLARQFPGLPRRAIEEIMAHTNARERLRLAQGRVPLRVAEEARVMQAQARLNKALLGLYRPELANADSRVLDEAIQAEHPDASASQRFQIAVADRRHAGTLIGQQPLRPGYRSPMRLADGRLGYPLSGRQSRGNPAEQRLRALYPSLSDSERRTRFELLRQRGDVATQLRVLELERDGLDDSLRQWENEGTSDQRPWRSMASNVINSAWSRVSDNSLSLVIMNLGELPSLLARFDHITTMHIQELNISQFPTSWFQSFPSLRTLRLTQSPQLNFESLFQALEYTPRLEGLELDNNQLTSLTGAMRQRLSSLPNLQRLNLRANNLELGVDDVQVLTRLPLEELDLQRNQITLDADMAGRFAQMHSLRVLRLNNNPLRHAPDLTGMTRLGILQLRDCQLQSWPPGLTALMSHADFQLRHLYLSDNPITQIADLDQVVASPFAQAVRVGSSDDGVLQGGLISLDQLANSPFARASRGDLQQSYWEFHENLLDAQSIRRLRDNGVDIDLHADSTDTDENFWLAHASQDQQQLWDELFEGDANRHLRDVIERVAGSAQARNNAREMSKQVWQLLEQAGRDEELRTHLDTIAQDYPPTCGDAGADAFSDLELELETYRVLGEEPDRPTYL